MNKGIVLILLGYTIWGLFPLYWALLKDVPAVEVLAHRMLWSAPLLTIVVFLIDSWRKSFFTALKDKRELGWLFVTAMLITVNWGVYIIAVSLDRVVEASMGYFLTPLLHILGGFLIFKEKISRTKQLAVLCATLGVLYYIKSVDSFPWVGLVLGISFASYGILRKFIKTPAVPGLFIETLWLVPISLGYVIFLAVNHTAVFLNVTSDAHYTNLWLMLAGAVTVIPLVLFTQGARLLTMTTTGILFYITPTLQFLVGAIVFGEPVNTDQLIGFAGIWLGLGIYTYSLISASKEIIEQV